MGGDARGERAALLLVDDNPYGLDALCQLLEPWYELTAAMSAEEGLRQAARHRPDAVVVDVGGPGGEGLVRLSRLLASAQLEGAAVLATGTREVPRRLTEALSAGAAEFLWKPPLATEWRARIDRAVRQAREREALQALARTDLLTGLPNYRALLERLDDEFKRAERYGSPLALALVDLDHLKEVNDRLGHEAGNRALCELARRMRETLREVDFAARFGGDEFVVLLPHQTSSEAAAFAERLRGALIAKRAEERPSGGALKVSVGIAGHWAQAVKEGPEALLRAADAALYQAKRLGRDRVVIFEQALEETGGAARHH